MLLLLYLFFIYHLIIWKPCVSVNYNDTEKTIRGILVKLIEELVLDATAKATSVQQYRHLLVKSTQYQYGTLIYEIKKRRLNMFQLYTRVESLIKENPLKVAMNNDSKNNENVNFVFDALIEIDNLAHEVDNFVAMIFLHDANLKRGKFKVDWHLHFRRKNMAPAWLRLVDSLAEKDINDLPEQVVKVPEENNQTHKGKRKNGVWHEAVSKE